MSVSDIFANNLVTKRNKMILVIDLTDQMFFGKFGNVSTGIKNLETELKLQKKMLKRIEGHAKVLFQLRKKRVFCVN